MLKDMNPFSKSHRLGCGDDGSDDSGGIAAGGCGDDGSDDSGGIAADFLRQLK
jgi:hypothetical protein